MRLEGKPFDLPRARDLQRRIGKGRRAIQCADRQRGTRRDQVRLRLPNHRTARREERTRLRRRFARRFPLLIIKVERGALQRHEGELRAETSGCKGLRGIVQQRARPICLTEPRARQCGKKAGFRGFCRRAMTLESCNCFVREIARILITIEAEIALDHIERHPSGIRYQDRTRSCAVITLPK